MFYTAIIIAFFLLMLLYFKIANHYNIVDKPNERSSHSKIVIRGGGIIFLFAAIIALCKLPELWLPISAIFLIGIISFLDDLYTLSNKPRILVHLTAVTMLLYYLDVFKQFPIYSIIAFYIIIIGTINAYNFMDGINGINGIYSLTILGGLQYINIKQISFIPVDIIWLPIIGCLVFLFFNFRKKAVCFAGDVGSISIAFWIILLLLKLILTTHNFIYILFLAVYGIDSVLTILHRLFLKENIFKAHRLHFYQLLVNEGKLPHLFVATIYAFIQLSIIILIISNPLHYKTYIIICFITLCLVYLLFKPKLMKLRVK